MSNKRRNLEQEEKLKEHYENVNKVMAKINENIQLRILLDVILESTDCHIRICESETHTIMLSYDDVELGNNSIIFELYLNYKPDNYDKRQVFIGCIDDGHILETLVDIPKLRVARTNNTMKTIKQIYKQLNIGSTNKNRCCHYIECIEFKLNTNNITHFKDEEKCYCEK